MQVPLDEALAQLRPLLLDPERLVRAVAAGRRRTEVPSWRRVELRPVDLKGGRRLQLVAQDERQAHTSNEEYGARAEASVDLLLAEPFGNWHVETVDATVQVRVTKRGAAQVHTAARDGHADDDARPHDRVKQRLLDPAEPFLRELGLTGADGRVRPSRQDKYRQVEELVRALDAVLDPAVLERLRSPLRVVDLGCGNGYLTFAVFRFLTAGRGLDVRVTGVDVKAQAREHGARVATALGWSDGVRFVEGSALDVPDAEVGGADVVLALHACDTATDEALARAVRWRASVVLAAPCCHHDVQRRLAAAGPPPEPYGLVARPGILRERFADVLTDALRAAVLRGAGYRVDVVEFVGSEHTPRNTLLRAVRTGVPATAQQQQEYAALTAAWGITPRLAELLDADPAQAPL